MDKPAQSLITEMVRSLPYRKGVVITFPMLEGFDIRYRYAVDAVGVCKAINKKFGTWVYCSTYTFSKTAFSQAHTNVCVSYRKREIK